MMRIRGAGLLRVAWALFLIFFVWSIPVQGDEATVDPGAGIGPLKLGMYVDDAAKLFGRRFDGQQTGTCTAGSKWVFKQGDTLLVSGEEALLSTAVVLQQSGTLVSMITISGPHGQYKTDVGVGLGSPGADVAAEFGPPTGESSEGGGKWLSYEQQGVRFLVSDPGDVVQAVSIFWRAPKNTEIRPFDGIGPLRLGMDIKTAHMAEGMGRPHDVVTPLGRLAWAMPVTPRYTRVSCTPYVAVRVGSGKVRDIFTTASGFWTAQGVQVGDSVDALVKELGSGQSSPSTPGSLLWVNSNTAAKLIAGLRAASDGTKQIVFFWIRAF